MATARLFTESAAPARVQAPAPAESVEVGLRWLKWATVVAAAGLAAVVMALAMRWTWRNDWEDVSPYLGVVGFMAAAFAWAVAAYGLRAERLGGALRADAQGVRIAGLGPAIPWDGIVKIECARVYVGSGWQLQMVLDRGVPGVPEASNSWLTWLTGRAAGADVTGEMVYVRLTYAGTTPQEAAARLILVGRRHGWQPYGEERHGQH